MEGWLEWMDGDQGQVDRWWMVGKVGGVDGCMCG